MQEKEQQYIYIYIYVVKLSTLVEGDTKAPFSLATTPTSRESAATFLALVHFTLDPTLIMLS